MLEQLQKHNKTYGPTASVYIIELDNWFYTVLFFFFFKQVKWCLFPWNLRTQRDLSYPKNDLSFYLPFLLFFFKLILLDGNSQPLISRDKIYFYTFIFPILLEVRFLVKIKGHPSWSHLKLLHHLNLVYANEELSTGHKTSLRR